MISIGMICLKILLKMEESEGPVECDVCGATTPYDDHVCCYKCDKKVCYTCLEFRCDGCIDSGYWCPECAGPMQLFVIRYAGNVKPPERLRGCAECYQRWKEQKSFQIAASCILCAETRASYCHVGGCYDWFCPHKDIFKGSDGTRCEKHLFAAECPTKRQRGF